MNSIGSYAMAAMIGSHTLTAVAARPWQLLQVTDIFFYWSDDSTQKDNKIWEKAPEQQRFLKKLKLSNCIVWVALQAFATKNRPNLSILCILIWTNFCNTFFFQISGATLKMTF